MLRIRVTKNTLPDKYWLVYSTEEGTVKHVDLSGCAASFERISGYVSEDGLRAVGWHYEEGGQKCWELFNIGHTLMYAPLRPSLLQTVGYLLRGKEPKAAHKEYLEAFEAALNQGGWKTVDRNEVKA